MRSGHLPSRRETGRAFLAVGLRNFVGIRHVGRSKPTRCALSRDQAPRDAVAQHVEDGVQDFSRRPDAWAALERRLWHQGCDHRPLGIYQIGLNAQARTAVLTPGGRGPHGRSSSGFSTLLESLPSRPLNPAAAPYQTGSRNHPKLIIPNSKSMKNGTARANSTAAAPDSIAPKCLLAKRPFLVTN